MVAVITVPSNQHWCILEVPDGQMKSSFEEVEIVTPRTRDMARANAAFWTRCFFSIGFAHPRDDLDPSTSRFRGYRLLLLSWDWGKSLSQPETDSGRQHSTSTTTIGTRVQYEPGFLQRKLQPHAIHLCPPASLRNLWIYIQNWMLALREMEGLETRKTRASRRAWGRHFAQR